jgi:hypothetical protein
VRLGQGGDSDVKPYASTVVRRADTTGATLDIDGLTQTPSATTGPMTRSDREDWWGRPVSGTNDPVALVGNERSTTFPFVAR